MNGIMKAFKTVVKDGISVCEGFEETIRRLIEINPKAVVRLYNVFMDKLGGIRVMDANEVRRFTKRVGERDINEYNKLISKIDITDLKGLYYVFGGEISVFSKDDLYWLVEARDIMRCVLPDLYEQDTKKRMKEFQRLYDILLNKNVG